jgi:hypothetical protein
MAFLRSLVTALITEFPSMMNTLGNSNKLNIKNSEIMVTVEIYDVVSRVKITEYYVSRFRGKKDAERRVLAQFNKDFRVGFKCYARCKF